MGDTRREILTATRRALIERGFRDLTTQAVAEELGRSHSLIHYHYDTKDDLVVAFLEFHREAVEGVLSTLANEDPGDRLARFLAVVVGGADESAVRGLNLAVYELQAYAGREDAYRDALAAYNRTLFRFVADCIEEGVHEGAFHEVDPEPTARLVLTAVDGALLQQYSVGVDTIERAVFEGLVDHVLADLYVGDPPEVAALAADLDLAELAHGSDDPDRGAEPGAVVEPGEDAEPGGDAA